MHAVTRGLVVYLVLLLIFRLSGKRTLAQVTTFDLVLTLIISECVQQALIGDDQSMTHAILLVLTLVCADILLSVLKQRSPALQRVVEGIPLVIIENGKLQPARMERERIDEADVLQAARLHHGLRALDDIDHAVVEASGGISVIPTVEARRAGQA
jgi:uncharacterized membrane protein YcaP (DUF421 family)